MGARFLSRVRQLRITMLMVLLWRLGPLNIVRVFLYRRRSKGDFYVKLLPLTAPVDGYDFWRQWSWRPLLASSPRLRDTIIERGNEIVSGIFRRFEDEKIFEGAEPQWHKGGYTSSKGLHFSKVDINATPGDDVKVCWDLSRFKWLSQLVVASIHAENVVEARHYVDRAQQLLRFWLSSNSYFSGVNWSCAQEVSIRGFHLINALVLLEKHAGAVPGNLAVQFIHMSYRRVEATIGYSLAQENNHSLTESLFLYYAPLYLACHGHSVCSFRRSAKHKRRARGVFARLVQRDGSFRMYSMNYHRAVCDIISLCKVIGDSLGDDFWDEPMLHQVKVMHEFLQATTLDNGQVPNIGHNDGSLHVLQYAPYGNYAPSAIFMGGAFDLPVDARFSSLQDSVYGFDRLARFVSVVRPQLQQFDDFGLAVVRFPHYQAFVKYARNAGRPQQEDFLHLDLWVRDENVLHDSGTYSYNPQESATIDYFDSAAAHNGPYLKDGSIVPKLGRFLYLDWPWVDVHSKVGESLSLDLSLRSAKGEIFHRGLSFSSKEIHIVDRAMTALSWGAAFNTPQQLSTGRQSGHVELLAGVILKSDNEISVGAAHYSKRYLDKLNGTRLLINGDANKVACVIELKDA